MLSSRAKVLSEGKEYPVGTGDIVWTRMGDEHQLLEIIDSPYGVAWLQTELRGRKRPGHLHKDSQSS